MAAIWSLCLVGLAIFAHNEVQASDAETVGILLGKKEAWVLDKALASFPPGQGGHSPYTTYNLTARCHQSLETYSLGLTYVQEWALRMFDADGVPPPGIISGHLHWLGSEEQCVRVKATGNVLEIPGVSKMTHDFDAKYCRAYYGYFLAGPAVSVGVCVPESCTTEDVDHMLRVPGGGDVTELPVFYSYCGEGESYKDDAGAIVATVILSIFAAFVLCATLVDYFLKWQDNRRKDDSGQVSQTFDLKELEENPAASNGSGSNGPTQPKLEANDLTSGARPGDVSMTFKGSVQDDIVEDHKASLDVTATAAEKTKKQQHGKPLRALLAFSLCRNVPRVLSTHMPPGAYTAFNGIRFFSMVWIILGHTWQLGTHVLPYSGILPIYGIENIYSQYRLPNRFTHQFINNMSLAVESFLLLSSCLVTISFMKQLDRQNGKPTIRQMVLYYVHRYWRLTPVYAILLMILATLYYHWATGPMATESLTDAENCKTNWWANLLYIQNLYEPDKMCMGWSWYLAVDFQYYVIAPLFAFLLYKFPKPGAVFLCLGYSGAITARSILYSQDDIVHFYDIYIKPWCRFGPYAIGIGLGYIMFRTKCKVKLPVVAVVVGWLVAIAFCMLAVYGSYNRGGCEGCTPWPAGLDTAYYVTYRDVFSISIAWLMFACCTGYGGVANTFLSWSGFVPLAKLTYIGYLVHPIIIYGHYFSRQRALFVDDLDMIVMFCAHLTLTLAASFVLTLMFEVPMLELEHIFLPSRKKKD